MSTTPDSSPVSSPSASDGYYWLRNNHDAISASADSSHTASADEVTDTTDCTSECESYATDCSTDDDDDDVDNYNDEYDTSMASEQGDTEVPVPFWFGHEEPEHVRSIIAQYELQLKDDITDPTVHRVRAPRSFVGRVKRTPVSAGNTFTTVDEVQVHLRSSLSPSKKLPTHRMIHVLTSWDEDGIPTRVFKLADKAKEFWMGKLDPAVQPSYLYTLPVLFTESEQRFCVSPDDRDVTEVDTWSTSDMVDEARERYPVAQECMHDNSEEADEDELGEPRPPHPGNNPDDPASPPHSLGGNLAHGPHSPNFPPEGMTEEEWEQQQHLAELFAPPAISGLVSSMAALLASNGVGMDDELSEFELDFGLSNPDGSVTRYKFRAEDDDKSPGSATFALSSMDGPGVHVSGTMHDDGDDNISWTTQTHQDSDTQESTESNTPSDIPTGASTSNATSATGHTSTADGNGVGDGAGTPLTRPEAAVTT
eukprot:TRINITY_DN37406_c0_g1_i1.p1 TRINITY_DN37406_c0_g1~~TRINITY_DN37406_c0_g1_i1.p1  ORF type:complete len:481 (-),score=85.10 TRINITY_DN37406_c0_g1_i1:119-1561(-)